MKKIAVVFGGKGYSVDSPLLYYAGRMAAKQGFEVLPLREHGEIEAPAEPVERKEILQVLAQYLEKLEEALKETECDKADDLLFIAKGEGALLASLYAQKHGLEPHYLLFSPVEAAFQFIRKGSGLVFCGVGMEAEQERAFRRKCDERDMEFHRIDGTDENLESEDLFADLRALSLVLKEIEAFFLDAFQSIYDMQALTVKGVWESMRTYEGKVLLIVNTATGCGFTPQYAALESMYEKYHEKGLEILDFPCNQFLQAPGSNEEIHSFCTARYNTQFPRFAKTEVNGANEAPVFRYLKGRIGFQGFDMSKKDGVFLNRVASEIDPDYRNNPDIKWNFTKFLVDRKGKVIARYEACDDLGEMEEDVRRLL